MEYHNYLNQFINVQFFKIPMGYPKANPEANPGLTNVFRDYTFG
jgi:hypothetical protein